MRQLSTAIITDVSEARFHALHQAGKQIDTLQYKLQLGYPLGCVYLHPTLIGCD